MFHEQTVTPLPLPDCELTRHYPMSGTFEQLNRTTYNGKDNKLSAITSNTDSKRDKLTTTTHYAVPVIRAFQECGSEINLTSPIRSVQPGGRATPTSFVHSRHFATPVRGPTPPIKHHVLVYTNTYTRPSYTLQVSRVTQNIKQICHELASLLVLYVTNAHSSSECSDTDNEHGGRSAGSSNTTQSSNAATNRNSSLSGRRPLRSNLTNNSSQRDDDDPGEGDKRKNTKTGSQCENSDYLNIDPELDEAEKTTGQFPNLSPIVNPVNLTGQLLRMTPPGNSTHISSGAHVMSIKDMSIIRGISRVWELARSVSGLNTTESNTTVNLNVSMDIGTNLDTSLNSADLTLTLTPERPKKGKEDQDAGLENAAFSPLYLTPLSTSKQPVSRKSLQSQSEKTLHEISPVRPNNWMGHRRRNRSLSESSRTSRHDPYIVPAPKDILKRRLRENFELRKAAAFGETPVSRKRYNSEPPILPQSPTPKDNPNLNCSFSQGKIECNRIRETGRFYCGPEDSGFAHLQNDILNSHNPFPLSKIGISVAIEKALSTDFAFVDDGNPTVTVKFCPEEVDCQTSKTRVRARLEIRTGRLAHTASRQGARSASEMQSCWLDKEVDKVTRISLGDKHPTDLIESKPLLYLLGLINRHMTRQTSCQQSFNGLKITSMSDRSKRMKLDREADGSYPLGILHLGKNRGLDLLPKHPASPSSSVDVYDVQMSSWSFLTISVKTLAGMTPCFTPESKIGGRVPDYHIIIVPCYVDGSCNLAPLLCPVCKPSDDGNPDSDEKILPSPKETKNNFTSPGNVMITQHKENNEVQTGKHDEFSNSEKLPSPKHHIEEPKISENNTCGIEEDQIPRHASKEDLIQGETTTIELKAHQDSLNQDNAQCQNNIPEASSSTHNPADTMETQATKDHTTTKADCDAHGNSLSHMAKRALFLTDKHSVAIIDTQKSGNVYIEWLKMCKCSASLSNSKKDTLRNRAKLLQIIDLIVEAKLAAPKELIQTFVNQLKGADAVNLELDHLGQLNETTRDLTVAAKKKIIVNSLIANSRSISTTITNPDFNLETDKFTITSSIKDKIPPLVTIDEELSSSENDTDEKTNEDERKKKKKAGCTKKKRKSAFTAKMFLKVKDPHSKLNKSKKLKGSARKVDGTPKPEGKTEKPKKRPKPKINSAEVERPSPKVKSKPEKTNAPKKGKTGNNRQCIRTDCNGPRTANKNT